MTRAKNKIRTNFFCKQIKHFSQKRSICQKKKKKMHSNKDLLLLYYVTKITTSAKHASCLTDWLAYLPNNLKIYSDLHYFSTVMFSNYLRKVYRGLNNFRVSQKKTVTRHSASTYSGFWDSPKFSSLLIHPRQLHSPSSDIKRVRKALCHSTCQATTEKLCRHC